jgi:NAD(P)H-dependent flavin oxidoreductase YrpB (nitropropane dioxygenase family)
MFCHDAEQTIEFMQSVKAPWIAFKVLAAGAISASDGIRYAFANGADFICLGMFDFQVEPDAELVIKAASRLATRARPWSR